MGEKPGFLKVKSLFETGEAPSAMNFIAHYPDHHAACFGDPVKLVGDFLERKRIAPIVPQIVIRRRGHCEVNQALIHGLHEF